MFKIKADDVRLSLGEHTIHSSRPDGSYGPDQYQEIRAMIILDQYKPTPRSRLRYDAMYISDRVAHTGGHERRTSWEILVGFTDRKLRRWLGGVRDENIIVPNRLIVAIVFGLTTPQVLGTLLDGKKFQQSLKQRLKYHRCKVEERPAELAERERVYAAPVAGRPMEEKSQLRYHRYNQTVLKSGKRRLAALEKLETITG